MQIAVVCVNSKQVDSAAEISRIRLRVKTSSTCDTWREEIVDADVLRTSWSLR